GAASGPLVGRSFAVKDIYDIAGHVTGCGNPDWLRSHWPAGHTAPAVARLLAAGARMTGKTITDELAFSIIGANHHHGTPLNSACPDRVPGGSSSGSAAAVAGGAVDFAVGSDTGGSVRAPASFCGILGFRPSHGRIALDHVMPLAPSFDTCGWFARDPLLLELVGRVLLQDHTPAAVTAPGRLLLAEDAFAVPVAAAQQALAPARRLAEQVLGPATPLTVAADGLAIWLDTFRPLQFSEIWKTHGAWIEATDPDFGPGVRERFIAARDVDPAVVAAAARRRETITRHMDALLADGAILCLPAAPDAAPRKDAGQAVFEDFRARTLTLTCIAGLARLPQVSLPLGRVGGCPIGLSLIAGRGNDILLLEAARRVMAAA
ncbi:MAG: amidase, partial [Alphaproteobacteria bacterium]